MSKNQIIELIGEILILIFLIKPMFQLSILTGIGYIITIISCTYDGSLFTKPNMARFIVGGTILTYVAGEMIHVGFITGDVLSTIIIFVIAAGIWIKGYFLKKGIEIK